jgi:hypothetical protein
MIGRPSWSAAEEAEIIEWWFDGCCAAVGL